MNKSLIICCLLAVLPLLANAQTCQTASIPATTPTSQFTDNNDGTVIDTKTGLMWKKCAEGQDPLTCSGGASTFNWQAALQRAQDVNSGTAGNQLNYADWRVPNIKELTSIVEEQCYQPAINTDVFPSGSSERFWSASPDVAYYENVARDVNFSSGFEAGHDKNYGGYVRLVRNGQ